MTLCLLFYAVPKLLSGVEELKIVVVESNWSQKQDDIASLHQRYIAVWQFVQE